MRVGVRLLLESIEGVEVVAEASDGAEALRRVREHRPDIVLADISMPGHSGLELARLVREEGLPTQVIVLSMHADEEYVRRAIDSGARGYLLKGSETEELELAIQSVAQGQVYLTPQLTRSIVDRYRDKGTSGAGRPADLTRRQREVLVLIARGESTKSAASRLGISVKTVETHRAQLMERLQIYEVAGLVRYAIRTGLIDPEE